MKITNNFFKKIDLLFIKKIYKKIQLTIYGGSCHIKVRG